MFKSTLFSVALLSLLAQTVSARYAAWQHSGSFYILTTPEGANLPASASKEGFPLLVRLDSIKLLLPIVRAEGRGWNAFVVV